MKSYVRKNDDVKRLLYSITVRRLFGFCLLACGLVYAASAADSNVVLQQSRALERQVLSVLGEHYRFEELLITPDNDKLLVFLSVPDGASVLLNQVTLRINGKVTMTYSYSGVELISLQQRSTHLLHIGRLPTGEHTIRLDVRVLQGNVRAMKDHVFIKDDNPKYIELQLVGYDFREVVANEW